MTGNEYQNLAMRTRKQDLTPIAMEIMKQEAQKINTPKGTDNHA